MAATNPSMKVAALRAASTKGGGRLRRPPPFVDSFMDGFVAAKEAADAARGVNASMGVNGASMGHQ